MKTLFEPEICSKLAFLLFSSKKYKVTYGGRGAQKSYANADTVLAKMIERKRVVAACREFHTTIKDSIHRLLMSRIAYYKLDKYFIVTNNSIICTNGSELTYHHLHNNITEVKGLEGVDLCWIFEAQNVSDESWDILIPTIRKEGSEFLIEFNPDYEDDPTYQRFVVHPPEDSEIVKINYYENPWCPDTLKQEAASCKVRDMHAYRHIWLGKFVG